MRRDARRRIDAFMRELAEGTRPAGALPSAAGVRLRMLGRARLARTRRALRPIRIMEALAGVAGGAIALHVLILGSGSSEAVAAPETLSLVGPSVTGGTAGLGTLALVAVLGVAIVVTAFSDA